MFNIVPIHSVKGSLGIVIFLVTGVTLVNYEKSSASSITVLKSSGGVFLKLPPEIQKIQYSHATNIDYGP